MRAILFAIAISSLLGCVKRSAESSTRKVKSPDDTYHNPVDQKSYVAKGGWKTYQPDVPRPDEPGKIVKAEQIRLLTAQEDIAVRTTVDELVQFIKEAERLADESFGKSDKQFRVIAQFNCKPTALEVKLAHQGDAPQELIQHYYDALTSARKLQVKEGEVSFQLELTVNPHVPDAG